jgi:3-hydroxyacyl-[acyl-carrier-protein] dehydratase
LEAINALAYPIYLDANAIESFIPHRKPMRFAESVTILANDHYTGTVCFPSDSFVVQGHFPGHSIVPGVMILEAGAQIAAAGLRAGDVRVLEAGKDRIGVLMAVRKCFFRRPVLPNDRLEYELRSRQISETVINVSGEVNCAGALVATLEFTFGQIEVSSLHRGKLTR